MENGIIMSQEEWDSIKEIMRAFRNIMIGIGGIIPDIAKTALQTTPAIDTIIENVERRNPK